ncbi:MAG: dihydrolipoamide acetyltransferase family protein, partial [Thermoanaerobaculum sp.]
EGEAVATAPQPAAAPEPKPPAVPEVQVEASAPAAPPAEEPFARELAPAPAAPGGEVFPAAAPPSTEAEPSEAELLRRRSSPLVRRIAAEHSIDLAQVPGTGLGGRVTKEDILSYIERQKAKPAISPAPPAAVAATPPPAPPAVPVTPPPKPAAAPVPAYTGEEYREPMSIMRQRIAEHMVASRRTSAHVQTVFEVDVSHIVRLREKYKDDWERQYGVKLTYTPFFLEAAIDALKAFPVLNASIDGNDIVYHRHINLGVAVALPHGLIVPVIKHAEELSLLGLQRALTDLATRARNKQLKPEEVQGSTFSVTNPGPYGNLFGLPIINQPNVAIMSIGNIQRRPVVIRDAMGREGIGISDVVYLALSFDHRLIDGAVADQFMAHIKAFIQEGRFSLA